MTILCWNCRGLSRPAAVRSMRAVIKNHQPQILGLVETKIRAKRWEKLRVSLGFLNCFAVERVGLGGGLAVLWREGVDVEVKSFSRYHVDMIVGKEKPYRLTLFYGNPVRNRRRLSWELLSRLAEGTRGPWTVMGDFNEVMYDWEVESRCVRDSTGIVSFRETVSRCGLMDFKAQGNPFTFSNKRMYPNEAKARLDRFLSNQEWLDLFPEAEASHGIANTSDHCPIVLDLKKRNRRNVQKGFKFEFMWHRHRGFPALIEEVWQNAQDNSPMSALANCGNQLSQWNRRTFGNVQKRIQELRKRLESLSFKQRLGRVVQEEREIRMEMDEWLEREEAMWLQRSRIDWLKGGDKNTPFFHAKASHRKKINWIEGLKSTSDELVTDPDDLMTLIVDHYRKVFRSEINEEAADWGRGLRCINQVVSEEMNEELMLPFTREDVRQALVHMAPSKAPGTDGFPAGFYQRHWRVVQEQVCSWVLSVLNSDIIWPNMNDTVLTLIPKCDNPERVEEYRPISLCNVGIKLVTKAITIRLKPLLPQIVSPSQSAFVEGRLISDNVIIAHEALHFIKTRKSKRDKFLSLKLDMCKAYDRMEWKFIKMMLGKLGFADGWIQLVIKLVTTVTYKVRANGRLSETITPTRGLRQGDPLSPYLFILCSEWLSRNFDQAVTESKLCGVKVGSTAPVISHLLFADDCLVFLRAEVDEARVVKEILEEYEMLSGQQINLAKSELVFGGNVSEDIRTAICEVLGVKEVSKHTAYLGLPTVIGHNKREVFRKVEDRVCKRINDWKCKVLSRAGKETLLKSVVQAVPLYAMQCFKIPVSLCERMEKEAFRFWWGSGKKGRPIHWISKEVLLKPKDQGGLGLRRLSSMNDALLLKQAWRILSSPDLLLSRIMKAKYFANGDIFEAGMGAQPSHVWRNLYKVKRYLMPSVDNQPGGWRWKLSSSGSFTTASVYWLLDNEWRSSKGIGGEPSNQGEIIKFWKRVWRSAVPKRVQMLTWRVFHEGLPVLNELRRRGCSVEGVCGFCGSKCESLAHVFIECWWAKAVWRVLQLDEHMGRVESGVSNWLVRCEEIMSKEEFAKLLCGIFFIWEERNTRHHGTEARLVEDIQRKVESLLFQMARVSNVACGQGVREEGGLYVACDASWTHGGQTAGIAAVANETGCIRAVNAVLVEGVRSVSEAEGLALVLGMKLAESLYGHKRITFITDSAEVFLASSRGRSDSRFNAKWLLECLEFLKRFKGWEVELAPRELNSVADILAKQARGNHWTWMNADAIPWWPALASAVGESY